MSEQMSEHMSEAELPPGPWHIVHRDHDLCFEVRAPSGEHIYIYYEELPERRAVLRRFSRAQAKRIALAMLKLADLQQWPDKEEDSV
jgi:hypothetical protein